MSDPTRRMWGDQPECRYRISKMQRGHFLDVNRLAMSPRAAARHNPEAFLAFAEEVAKVAADVRRSRAQMELPGMEEE